MTWALHFSLAPTLFELGTEELPPKSLFTLARALADGLGGTGAGVGIAVGRSVRLSIVSTAILDFFLTLVLFGTETSVRVAG